jgi:NADP-dependent 3-hydroxy acid dehydrogenase YdfG
MNPMKGKTLFVTGGNVGIGLATALAFAEQGVNIAIYARRTEKNVLARELIEATGVKCMTFAGDATDENQLVRAIEETAQKLGGLHYAFNNVGVSQTATTLAHLSLADYDHQMDGNVKSTFFAMKHEIPAIIASGGGAICNNASASGLVATSHQALYSAAKFAVVGLTGRDHRRNVPAVSQRIPRHSRAGGRETSHGPDWAERGSGASRALLVPRCNVYHGSCIYGGRRAHGRMRQRETVEFINAGGRRAAPPGVGIKWHSGIAENKKQ